MTASRALTTMMLLAATLMSATVFADWNEGLEAYKARDYETAEAEFRMVIQMHPDYSGGPYMLGLCQMMTGRMTEALANLRKAHELEPGTAQYLLTLARAEIRAKHHLTAYNRLIGVDITHYEPNQVAVYRMLLAEAAIQTDRAEIAVEVMQLQLAEYGEPAEAYVMLGRAFDRLGRSEEAVQAWLIAFDRESIDLPSTRRAIDLALEIARASEKGWLSPEIALLADHLASAHPSRDHLLLAGNVNLTVGNIQKASEWLEIGFEKWPQDAEIVYLSASALTRIGESEEAYDRLTDALYLQPSTRLEAEIHSEMARIDESSFDLEAAVEHHLKAGDDDRAHEIDTLKNSLVEPLALRESYTEQVNELRRTAGETGMHGAQADGGNLGHTISGLQGNIALIEEELEQAKQALQTGGGSPETQRILQTMNNTLLRKLIRPNPEDLGLIPLAMDELVVIVRPDEQRSPNQEPVAPPQLSAVPSKGKEIPLPLRHTEVNATINAYIASVEVRQEYRNPYEKKIEAVYAFPLPQDASVNEFVMTIGARKIRGIIRERGEAERIYEEARKRGHVASLLTQERPNIFVQSIANIEPEKTISVAITYYNTLPYRDGAYEFVFPTVVGPRFNPQDSADPIAAPTRGTQKGQGTEVQYLAPEEISSHRISVSVDLEAGIPIEKVRSATHAIEVEKISASHRRITLAESTTIPNRDFILRWEVAGELIKNSFLLHEDEDGKTFTLVITPPKTEIETPRSPVEHVFVVDCSGSMKGEPLEMAKEAVERALEKLEPSDTFQIIRFSSRASALGPRPVPASAGAIRRGLEYLDGLEGHGGTMMIEGIKAALDFPHKPGAVRLVFLVTDGFIGNEAEILTSVQSKLGASKIFTFGVGSAPNRFLLERLAKLGQGAAAYITLGDVTSAAAIDTTIERMSHPSLSDIKIDWEGMDVREILPARVPDLYPTRPVILTGRLEGRVAGHIIMSGFTGGKRKRFSVPLTPEEENAGPELTHVWARMKIAELAEQSLWARDRESVVEQIRVMALQYGVLSKYTAFIAVDASRKTPGDHDTSVVQAVPVPAGMSHDTRIKKDDQKEPN